MSYVSSELNQHHSDTAKAMTCRLLRYDECTQEIKDTTN